MELRKPSIFVINWVSSCLSFFVSALAAVASICTTRICTTTIISLQPCGYWMLSFSISYWDLIKFPYSADTTQGGGVVVNSIAYPQTIESPNSTHSETHIDVDTMSACTKGWQCLLISMVLTNQGRKANGKPNLPRSTDKGREERSLFIKCSFLFLWHFKLYG